MVGKLTEDIETKKYWVKRLLDEIKKKEGRGTELISLYIPPKKRISDIVNYLRQEYSTAANIKSDTTRKNVQSAILKVIERLKYYNQAPENGLVIFCGAIPRAGPGTEKMEIYVIEPPEPLNVNLYRCDDHFHTEYLEETLREKEVYGLISIDVNDAAIGLLEGRRLDILGTYTSGIPGKHRAGGQSARRFERLREQEIHHYFNRIAKHVNEFFLREDVFNRLRGILIGGPGFTKKDFVEGARLDYRLKEKIIDFIDTNYSGEEGLRELVNKGREILRNVRYIRERDLVNEFLKRLTHDSNMVLYGIKEVVRNIETSAIDTILILEDINKYRVEFTCSRCGHKVYRFIDKIEVEKVERIPLKCPKCKIDMEITDTQQLIDYLYSNSKTHGYKVEILSPKTEHGKILRQFEGIAALLRFQLNY